MSKGEKLFLPYQSKWIRDNSRLKLMEKSRQIGLSWATAYRLDRETSKKDQLFDSWVSSRDEMQARLFIEDCKAFANILQVAATDLGVQVIDEASRSTAHVIQFANGKRIHSMSSNPDAQAGKRGSRCLDEFALHPDPRKLWAIAYPGITWGGSMEVISTHRGSVNLFNRLVIEAKEGGNPKGISLHTCTLQDALDQGFLDKLKGKLPKDDSRQEMDVCEYFDFIKAGCPDEETFQQEYMCQPADDTTAFLSYDLISGCYFPAGEEWQKTLGLLKGPLYVGVDVGRQHDLTVIWVLDAEGSIAKTRMVNTMKGVTFSDQEEVLWSILELPNVKRCCIDATGMGMQFAERAKERFGYKVEPITFTVQSKEELAYPLRAAFEDKKIQIPDDRLITADLRAIKKIQSTGGNVRFAADRGTNGHADRFWAVALAWKARSAGGPPPPMPRAFTNNRRSRALERRKKREVIA